MKYQLPDDHGLSKAVQRALVFTQDDRPALSNVQYEALSAGVARGQSQLVVSPTSTGKTQIALWAVASSLEAGCNTVYLVTHRALAKQKFQDFSTQLLSSFLDNDPASLVIATGDYVEDAGGDTRTDPLRAALLVATYEKYLALVSASGIPTDMRSTTVVCDEIQLIGDRHRGQNVEVLLSLLRIAGWRQFVGLSAVLREDDARELAGWLGVKLVSEHTREKHLRYECWTERGMVVATSERPDQIEEGLALPPGVDRKAIPILSNLLKQRDPPVPVIVFCMSKRESYELAEQFMASLPRARKEQLSLAFEGLPETAANDLLSRSFEGRVAIHNADLTDDERHIVEQHLLEGKLDVVFATSTLAAGVNFPLGAAVFASWARWDGARRMPMPIEASEFHNMAGRVGRMGFSHATGRVVFCAEGATERRTAKGYLNLGELPGLKPRVEPAAFNRLALQLVASGLCTNKGEITQIVCATFSGLREEDRNRKGFEKWPAELSRAVDSLLAAGMFLENAGQRLAATPIGKAVAYSGLRPETGLFLLNYVMAKVERLVGCLPRGDDAGNLDRLAFLLFASCLSSPEFRQHSGKQPSRPLPFPLEKDMLFDADVYRVDLVDSAWRADIVPINGAKLACDWINGAPLRKLEATLPQLSAGMLHDLYRNLAWVLQGMAAVVSAAADPRVPLEARPEAVRREGDKVRLLSPLPRAIRRFSSRVTEGLPDDVLWLAGIRTPDSRFRLTRGEILSLRASGFGAPQMAMLGSREADAARTAAFAKARPTPRAKANWFRDACRDWKASQRSRAAERHLRRARRCNRADIVEAFYRSRGSEFEQAFEDALLHLRIQFRKLDDGERTGAPDYLLRLGDSPDLVVELKSRQAANLVDYNRAVEVLAASEVHGHKETFCVTVCHPGVDPSVPLAIASCGRLSVVESPDLGEALLRCCEGVMSQVQLFGWLASPGQASAGDLPFREYG